MTDYKTIIEPVLQEGTTLILDDGYTIKSISVDRFDLNINDMFEDLIIPMLLAAGYSQKTIDDYFE